MPPRCYGITPWLSCARPRSSRGKWYSDEKEINSTMESARLRLEKRRVTRRETRGRGEREREGKRDAARSGKWIKFRRMFPFWTRRGIDMARLWNGSFAARLFISVAAASRMLQDGGRSRSRREMLCKIKLLRPPSDVNICRRAHWIHVILPRGML